MNRLMLWIGIAAVFAVVGCKRSVPKVEGQDLKSATSKLEQSGFKLGSVNQIFTGTSESGIVVSQNPTAATKMPKGSLVELTVEQSVTLPAFVGSDFLTALRTAGAQGLRVTRKNKPTKEAPAGTVLDQSPLAGQRVPPGTPVELLIASVKGPLDSILNENTKKDLGNLIKEGISNKLSGELLHLLDADKAKHKDNEKEKHKGQNNDPHPKEGNGKGSGNVISEVISNQLDKQIDKGIDKAFGKESGKDIGKDLGKDVAKDIGKGLSHKMAGWFNGRSRNDQGDGRNSTDSDASQALAAPAQLSPFQGENVTAIANRVSFEWAQVTGAATYTVEIEALSGKKWVKLETRSALVETTYSATVAARTARWRVRAVDYKQKVGPASNWATFAVSGTSENTAKAMHGPKKQGLAQVVSN